MKDGEVDAVIVVPDGYGAAARGRRRPGRARRRTSTIVHRPVAPASSVGGLPGGRQRARRRQPGRAAAAGRARDPQTVQTENLTFISYFVPSMLALSVMQLGIFAAIPLVADREKRILKRLAATPLRRWQLVGSNVLDAAAHRARPDGHHRRGRRRSSFGVEIVGLAASWRRPSSSSAPSTFLALGYVLASFTKTEEAANGHHPGRPVPDDVPVGRLLPDRGDARVPAVRSPRSSR